MSVKSLIKNWEIELIECDEIYKFLQNYIQNYKIYDI